MYFKVKAGMAAAGLLIFGVLTSGAVAEETISKTVMDGFRRADDICGAVEKIRGLAFKDKVKTDVQSKSDFEKFVRKSVETDYGKEKSVWLVRALVKLGLLEKDFDLTETMVKMLQSQAAAHYDPETKKCYLLQTDVDPLSLDLILSHELDHALQDQHFDLYSFAMKDVEAMRDNGDAAAAKSCLMEGDATLVMMFWMAMKQAGIKEASVAEPVVSLAVGAQAALDYDAIMAMAENNDNPSMAAFGASLKEMKDMPRYLMESLYDEYIDGALMVSFVKSRGGWAAVDELYKNPPQSTEQVLHPEKLVAPRDVPVDVRLPELQKSLSAGWALKDEDVLGELGMRIMFEIWGKKSGADSHAAAASASGWGGDRYYYFTNAVSSGDLLVWKTVWDTEQDAGKFLTAYRVLLATRFPALKKAGKSDSSGKAVFQEWEVEPGRFIKLARTGKTVGVIDTTSRSCLDVMWK